jgi:hypothetical protein
VVRSKSRSELRILTYMLVDNDRLDVDLLTELN